MPRAELNPGEIQYNATVLSGLINLDKPPGLSSAAAVNIVKRLLPRGTKIGHAGTLDPFATGVLVLLVGNATKLCEQVMAQPKQYLATVKLDATTETLDPTSPEMPVPMTAPASREAIDAILPRFIGLIDQRPPAYSALKLAGQPAYKLARKGKQPELAPRKVHVYGIHVIRYAWPLLELRVDCGRGTYIRSLARDIGQALGAGGYLTSLRRTRVGEFRIDAAVSLDQIRAGGVEAFLT